MTIRDINSTISTVNYAIYSIREAGVDVEYKDLHYSEIPQRLKDAKIFRAVPMDISFNSVKRWRITIM